MTYTYDLEDKKEFVYSHSETSIEFINISKSNVEIMYDIIKNKIPSENLTNILFYLSGKISHLEIPNVNGRISICCDNMGLDSIYVSDCVDHLFCEHNNLQTLEVPNSIMGLTCDHNKITKLSFRNGDPYTIGFLNMRYNNITTFDHKLPDSIYEFNIIGNDNIRLKYMDNLIYESLNMVSGDYDEVLFKEKFIYTEAYRARLYILVQSGKEYITMDDIEGSELWN